MNNSFNPEKYIDTSLDTINLPQMKKIIEQMNKSVFKITTVEKGFIGTGFLCKLKIPFSNNDNYLSFFATNYHVLGEDDLKDGRKFGININGKMKDIQINNSRNIYKSKELDVVFIEIIEEDKINIKDDCLEIDDFIMDNDIKSLENDFTKKSIYIIHNPKGKETVVSFGLSNYLEKNNLHHKCNTDNGSSGSPILSLDHQKIIAIHRGNNVNKIKENFGVFIKNPINEFLKQIKEGKKYSELTLKYKIDFSSSKIQLFGEDFVRNNKENCKIIIENKEEELNAFLRIENMQKQNSDILEVKLRIKKKLKNMSYMFKGCQYLYSIDDMCNFNTNSVTNMSNMFSYCYKLSSLSVISYWDTSNVTNIESMFSNCSSLKYLPDISKWNTSKVTSMQCLFYKCNSLVKLPDISNWNITNVTNIESMFNECSSLNIFPDISKWKTFNVTDMGYLFNKCEKLTHLPDISNWDICKVNNIVNIFSGCKLLTQLPDISNWNTSNIQNMKSIFQDCESLKYLPDISKWNTNNVNNMSSMFKNCSSLLDLPNISKWNINSLRKKNDMFSGCPIKKYANYFEKGNNKNK